MKTFRDTFEALKRRVGDNTDPVPHEVALSKVAADLGLSKEALMGLITRPLSWGASGLANLANATAGKIVANPGTALEIGAIGHMALGEKDRLNQRMAPKFRAPKGIGVHD